MLSSLHTENRMQTQEKRHTSFSVVDILSPTKFNGGLSPTDRQTDRQANSVQDNSDHENSSGKLAHYLLHCLYAFTLFFVLSTIKDI